MSNSVDGSTAKPKEYTLMVKQCNREDNFVIWGTWVMGRIFDYPDGLWITIGTYRRGGIRVRICVHSDIIEFWSQHADVKFLLETFLEDINNEY